MEVFPSVTWLGVWVRLANEDAAFMAASVGFDGAIGLVLLPANHANARATYMRLTGLSGRWHDARMGNDPGLVENCEFVLSATFPVWRSLIEQELNPLRGLVQGRLRLSGQLSTMLRWSEALLAMTRLAGEIGTQYDQGEVMG